MPTEKKVETKEERRKILKEKLYAKIKLKQTGRLNKENKQQQIDEFYKKMGVTAEQIDEFQKIMGKTLKKK